MPARTRLLLATLAVLVALAAPASGASEPLLDPDTIDATFTPTASCNDVCPAGEFTAAESLTATVTAITATFGGPTPIPTTTITIRAAAGSRLAVGSYPSVTGVAVGTTPGLTVQLSTIACTPETGSVEITRLDVAPDGYVLHAALSLVHRCGANSDGVSAAVTIDRPLHPFTYISAARRDLVVPVVTARYQGWTITTPGVSATQATVRLPDGRYRQLNPARTRAYLDGLDGATALYEQAALKGTNWDLHLRNVVTGRATTIPRGINTRAAEWGAGIAPTTLSFVRDLPGRISKIFVYDRRHRRLTTIATSPRGSLVFPTFTAGRYVVYGICAPSCRVVRYDMVRRARVVVPAPSPSVYDYSSTVTSDGTVYFARSGEACGSQARIMRWTPGGGVVQITSISDGSDVYGISAFTSAGGTSLYYSQATCATELGAIMVLPLRP